MLQKKWKWLLGCFLALAWSCILFILYKTNGNLTVDTLLRYRPNNVPLTLLALLGIFLLKSVDFLLTTGILFAAVGVMFPLPAAIAINLAGAGIVLMVPYGIGQRLGQSMLQSLLEKYPTLSRLHKLQNSHQLLLAVLLRVVGVPINAGTLYMSASGFQLSTFLAGSYLGWLPSLLCYTVIGAELHDFSSPVLWIAIGLQILLCVAAFLGCRLYQRRSSGQS